MQDPIERIIPTGGCLTCGYKTCQQTERGLRQSYYRHRKKTGHDNFWQTKFAPAKIADHALHGMPTFKCKTEGCEFVTRAKSKKVLLRALGRHHAATGHEAITRIPGAQVKYYLKEEEFGINKTE